MIIINFVLQLFKSIAHPSTFDHSMCESRAIESDLRHSLFLEDKFRKRLTRELLTNPLSTSFQFNAPYTFKQYQL